ncbi:MAG: hypothetical protein IJ770_01825 [Alphaproteobacteria bacterium]|nr:hypothetical protein [Alphaproteobacteria bacterium]
MKYQKIFMLGMLFSTLAYSANAAVCYLPEGCDGPENYAYTSLLKCSTLGGYYNKAPAGYNCVSAESECPGMVKCEPDDCIKRGYTYVGVKENEDAWEYISCPKNVTSANNTLFYKRTPIPCESGFSIAVSADDCQGGFVTSHNSGDNVCGKCLGQPEDEDDVCQANGLLSASYQPEGCQVCHEMAVTSNSVKCQECEDFSDSYFTGEELSHNNCVKNYGKSVELTGYAGSITCFKKGNVVYKTAQEAGCHKENYNALSCSCTGDDDGCPDGYFKEIYGDCPQGSSFGKADDDSKCISCVYETCSASSGIQTSSVRTMAADESVVTTSDTLKRTYVDKESGNICTETCDNDTVVGGLVQKNCSTSCVGNSTVAAPSFDLDSDGEDDNGDSNKARGRGESETCEKHSVFSGDTAVFNR